MVQLSIGLAVVLLSGVSISIADGEGGYSTFFFRGCLFNGTLEESYIGNRDVPEEYIEQRLDHSKPTDTRIWKQRYFTNGIYYKKGGPVFLSISGESPASKMVEGEWTDTAKEFNALCFQIEHRFYGKSQPMKNMDTESLVYLTSQQALADLAFFIQAMNKRYEFPLGTKWVVFGGSYAGSLAAWMRLQYPHVVHAAVSSSAPLQAKLDFNDFYKVVRNVIRKNSAACLEAISDGIKQIEILLQKSSAQSEITEMLRLCNPVDTKNKNNMILLFEYLASGLASLVQYDDYNGIRLAKVCRTMVDKSIGTPLQRFSLVISTFLTDWNQTCMNPNYENLIKYLAQSSLTSEAVRQGSRQWAWQTCTEFGFLLTTTEVSEISGKHGVSLDFSVKQCQRLFGERFDENFQQTAVERTNRMYGGVQLHVSQVIYLHGSNDPWHPLGMLQTSHEEAPAIIIEGTSHCADLRKQAPGDPEQLNKARRLVRSYLGKWLISENPTSKVYPTPGPDPTPTTSSTTVLFPGPILFISVIISFFTHNVYG